MTVHDLVPLLVPGAVPRRAALVFRLAFGAARECERVITVSRFTAAGVCEHLGLPPARVAVTPLGVDLARYSGPGGARCPSGARPYLLHVGGFDQEKNLEMLLRVMEGIAGDPPGPELVVAGEGGERARAFQAEAARRGLAGRVRLAGRLGEEALAEAYAGALLFLFPSRWEGFGLPPLEAMAAGCPVVCSGAASLPEVVGEAGVLLPPDRPERWIQTVRRLLADPEERDALSRAGRERASRFTWEATAERTVRAYRGALEAR
jgi:glycosyltransferase involved in cell wall biosynthesis